MRKEILKKLYSRFKTSIIRTKWHSSKPLRFSLEKKKIIVNFRTVKVKASQNSMKSNNSNKIINMLEM